MHTYIELMNGMGRQKNLILTTLVVIQLCHYSN